MTRRHFSLLFASASVSTRTRAQAPTLAHQSIAALDRGPILQRAAAALALPVPNTPPSTQGQIRLACNAISSLCAAILVAPDQAFSARLQQLVAALFMEPRSRLNPTPEIANPVPSAGPAPPNTLTLVDLAPLAETARACSLLSDTLSPEVLEATRGWLAAFLDWLTTARNPVLARDTKDHNASAWLLLTSAASRALGPTGPNVKILDDCRHRFRKPTLRNQINLQGAFPHEVSSEFPFRNSLLNFDLLAGCAQLLSTPFDDLWPFELEDGTGLRSAAAFLYPALQERHNWPYVADPQFFRDLPGRRPALLFAGRAYNRPEYIQTWLNTPPLDPEALPAAVAASFPIREPLLFTARAPHGL